MAIRLIPSKGEWAWIARSFCGVALLLAAASCACSEEQHPESYTQTVLIQFGDSSDAHRAKATIASLFNDHHRAVSCRWDDNWTSDNVKTRKVMEEYDIRGTWYLNDRRFSPTGDNKDYLPTAKVLQRGGNSIGCHTLTHPFLTYFHSNRMFEEMAGCRVVWEAALDRPITSYAYSFVDVRPGPEDRRVTVRTLKTLRRAGYHHIAEYVSFFNDIDLELELSPILPPENESFESFQRSVDWAYSDANLTRHHPMLSNSMHAWYETPFLDQGYDALRRRFDVLSGLEDVWHCNQNQYAAYRRQHRWSTVRTAITEDGALRVELERPTLLSVNDSTPITVKVEGVSPESVVALECATADATKSQRKLTGGVLFHLSHDSDQQLPTMIAHIDNLNNESEYLSEDAEGDLPWIRGGLSMSGNSLQLNIVNNGTQLLEDCRVTWRTPLGWKPAQPFGRAADLPPSERVKLQTFLTTDSNPLHRIGQPYFVAEVDCSSDDQPLRVFFTCRGDGERPDASWPLDRFSLLGPFADDSFDAAAFVKHVRTNGCPDRWPGDDGQPVAWRPAARDGYVNYEWLNPEYVRTMGTWDAHSPNYVLRSTVHSGGAREALVVTSHPGTAQVLVNGLPLENFKAQLKAGDNDLLIVYPSATLCPATQRLTACFVRLADPVSGERLPDIKYAIP